MKVAIIGQTLNKNWANKISGGIQTVERLHVKIFLVEGWDVYFIAPADCEHFLVHDKLNFCLTESTSQESSGELDRADKARLSRKSGADVRQWLDQIQPDLVINHSFSSSHTRIAAEISHKIPTLSFSHNLPETAMDIGVIAKVQHYLKMTENGGSLVSVTQYQRDLWRSALKKRVTNSEAFNFLDASKVDKIYTDTCFPVYINRETVRPPQDHFVVISRPDPIKNLHTLLELSTKVNPYKLELFLSHPGKLEENEYFVKKLQPKLDLLKRAGHKIILHHNAPRQELLDKLSTAIGNFVPCTIESASITLLEAASYGVRSIVFGKTRENKLGHAGVDMLGDHLSLMDVSKGEEASVALAKHIKNFEYGFGNRQELSDYTVSKHSFDNRRSDMMAIVNARTFTKQDNLLEF